jgi:hypothetical protein
MIETRRASAEIQRSLGRVEGKLDLLLAALKERNARDETRHAAHDERHDGHDARLRKVENRQYWLSGAGAALGSLVTAVVSRFLHQG